MKNNIILRILAIVLTLFIVTTVLFFVFSYISYTFILNMTFKEFFPIGLEQYKEFLSVSVIGGDWGYTVENDLLLEVVLPKFWYSFRYIILALIISIPIGFVLGVITALYHGTIFEKIISNIVLSLGSMPTFLLATAGVVLFGYVWHILPKCWYFVHFGFATEFQGLIIPVLTLCIYPIARICITVKGEILESFNSEQYILCKCKGLTRLQIILRHSTKEVLLPLMPVIVDMIVFVITGSFVVEIVYKVPGIGDLLLESLIKSSGFGGYIRVDVNSIILIVAYYVFICMSLILIADIIQKNIDPRVKQNVGIR